MTVIPYRPSDEIVTAVADEVFTRWPFTFPFPPKPIAVGLGRVIVAALATTPPNEPPWHQMTYTTLEQAVGFVLDTWCSNPCCATMRVSGLRQLW
jgi:hypothetical protein